MNKLLITHMKGRVLTALFSSNGILQMELEEDKPLLGGIYIGKVKNISRGINSAFVEFREKQIGYYSLTDNKTHLFTDTRRSGSLKPGDELVVQVVREAVKTKEPVLTSNLNFTGRYCILTVGKTRISFSAKINDIVWKEQIRSLLESEREESFGIILRTNSYGAAPELIASELRELKDKFHDVMATAKYRTCFSVLFQPEPPFIKRIKDTYSESMEEIVTDDLSIYGQLREYLSCHQPENLEKLCLYSDFRISMSKVYKLEKAFDEALARHVWLKSGGYLVIEPTEAMTVIDVNTGKYSGSRNFRDTIMKINLEAAQESARQMRLRNLSGIIIIDFIDMDMEEDRKLLLHTLSNCCAEDPVKTTVVDITRLNLVEVTRKKVKKPFLEQVRECRLADGQGPSCQ